METKLHDKILEQEPAPRPEYSSVDLAPNIATARSLLDIKNEQPSRAELEVRMGILCRQVQLLRGKCDEELIRMQRVESASNSGYRAAQEDYHQNPTYQEASQNNAVNCTRLAKAQARYSRAEVKLLFPVQ